MTTLLAVPNFSEGRDENTIEAIRRAFGGSLLDVHADADHHRSVFTVAGRQGELAPDFGPRNTHPTAGAVLVGARPPLVAFNLELDEQLGLDDAQRIAAAIREGGPEGLVGVRAIGLWLPGPGVAQVSTNVEGYEATPLAKVLEAVSRQAPVTATELVGLAPQAAFDGFPEDVPIRNKRTIEDALSTTEDY